MDCFLVYSSIFCILVIATVSEGSRPTFEMTSSMPLKGSNVQFSCSLSEPFTNGAILILKGNNLLSIIQKNPHRYFSRLFTHFDTITANSTGTFGIISHLTTEDEGAWSCIYEFFREDIISRIFSNIWNLTVYTIPSGLSITQNPEKDVDLSENSVVLHCNTIGCTYPIPTIQWMFKIFHDQATLFEDLNAKINQTGRQETCTGQEMVYTSTLQLPLYTTFNDNSGKTGTFYCRIEYPDPSRNIISNVSHSVTFAEHPLGRFPLPAVTGIVIGAAVLVTLLIVAFIVKRISKLPKKRDDINNGTQMRPTQNANTSAATIINDNARDTGFMDVQGSHTETSPGQTNIKDRHIGFNDPMTNRPLESGPVYPNTSYSADVSASGNESLQATSTTESPYEPIDNGISETFSKNQSEYCNPPIALSADVSATGYESLQARSTTESPYQTIDNDEREYCNPPEALRVLGTNKIYMNAAHAIIGRGKENENQN